MVVPTSIGLWLRLNGSCDYKMMTAAGAASSCIGCIGL